MALIICPECNKEISDQAKSCNSVGDVLRDDVSGRNTASLVFTGPLKPGKTSSKTYWRACFYNSTYSGSTGIKRIEIEYSDETTLVLEEGVAGYAVKAWR